MTVVVKGPFAFIFQKELPPDQMLDLLLSSRRCSDIGELSDKIVKLTPDDETTDKFREDWYYLLSPDDREVSVYHKGNLVAFVKFFPTRRVVVLDKDYTEFFEELPCFDVV